MNEVSLLTELQQKISCHGFCHAAKMVISFGQSTGKSLANRFFVKVSPMYQRVYFRALKMVEFHNSSN